MKKERKKTGLKNCDRRTALRWTLWGAAALVAPPGLIARRRSSAYWGEGVLPRVRDYVRSCYDYAWYVQQRCGIPVWGTFAVCIHESDAGRSPLATIAKNHHGIKALRDWDGPLYCKEVGRDPRDGFIHCEYYRRYDSDQEGFNDFGRFLAHPRYRRLPRSPFADCREWVEALHEAGYAEDEAYTEGLLKRIEDYRLEELKYRRPAPVYRA